MNKPLTTAVATEQIDSSILSLDLIISLGEPSEVHVGRWCIVFYDIKPYPGIIINTDATDWGIEVKVMHRIVGY